MHRLGTCLVASLVCLFLGNCSHDNEPDPLLIGTWLWEGSSGGFGGAVIKPRTGEEVMLKFDSDRHFSLRRNDTLLYSGTFYTTKTHSIYSGKDDSQILTLREIVNNSVRINSTIVIDGIIIKLTTDQLSTGDNHYDGYGSSFSRQR